jgi:hypothetical protein
MTAVRSAFDRGATALIRAGADLRAADAALAALTAGLDDSVLLGADGFADLVDPGTADDRLAVALARLAADAGASRRGADRPGERRAEAARPARPATGTRPPTPARDGRDATTADRETLYAPRTSASNGERGSADPARAPAVGHKVRATAPAPDRAGRTPSGAPSGAPSGSPSGSPSGAPALSARGAAAPVRLDLGLSMPLRRALLSGDARAIAAEVARIALDGVTPDLSHAAVSSGPLSAAETRIVRALARLEARPPTRPTAPPLSGRSAPANEDQGTAAPAPGAPSPTPVLVGERPSGLRRLAERAGAVPAAPPEAAPSGAVEASVSAPPGPADRASVSAAAPAGVHPAPPSDPAAPPGSEPHMEDDTRLADRLADLLRREARAQGIGGGA